MAEMDSEVGGNFEDKFTEILGNQEAMSQIMSIAQSLGGDLSGGEGNTEGKSFPDFSGGDFTDMLQGLDPKHLAMGMRLMNAYQSQHRSMELMRALRPFLREERQVMIQRLSHATKLAKVATSLVEIWQEQQVLKKSSQGEGILDV